MTGNPLPAAQHSDIPLELHRIISRMGCDNENPDEMGTLGAAAARIILLEHTVRNLLSLLEETPYPELHVSVRDARSLVDRI